ncbi:hypothetical protein EXIGLDRAFT_733708 [Exidia glandulosa HHB12029]|uniref:Uncharacterized protein n=1 Tax=Exidia glandulosa HHB12029 TaxID=1314781 RepID=A0A165B834_EXIGL|nr:hypothetical protein EXIGLDRAFT_733708 [Exidia glandulosa HHB12029]
MDVSHLRSVVCVAVPTLATFADAREERGSHTRPGRGIQVAHRNDECDTTAHKCVVTSKQSICELGISLLTRSNHLPSESPKTSRTESWMERVLQACS